jgi:hypothetical protein
MNKFKAFIIGTVFGSFMLGGIGYAADRFHIEVSFPAISYWVDGKEAVLTAREEDMPLTINYKGVNYVPVRQMAEVLGKEVGWDHTGNRINLKTVEILDYETVSPDDYTPGIEEWINTSLNKKTAQVKVINQDTYILVTLGEKNTGGFEVDITQVKQYFDGITVVIEKNKPDKGDFVTEGLTYPYSLIKLKGNIYGSAKFVETSGEAFPKMEGIKYIPSIMKETEQIMLFEPVVNERTIMLRGAVRTFEGLIAFSILDKDGNTLQYEKIQAAGFLPNWGYFQKNIALESLNPNSTILFHIIHDHDEIIDERIELLYSDFILP